MALLGHDLVLMHGTPITHMDPEAQKRLLEQTAKT